MQQEYTRPTYIDVANHFYHDARDFHTRYKYCMESEGPIFYTPRSMRAKCFIDLRMGIESILKCLICYFKHDNKAGKKLVSWIEGYSHKITKMLEAIKDVLPAQFLQCYSNDLLALDELPVSLRYRLDALDFRDNREDRYYETIGSDAWLTQISNALSELVSLANDKLRQHSRIVSSVELLAEIMEPHYRKYR